MSIKILSSVDIEGTCLEIPNIKITSGATDGAVLTSDATGFGTWCETVDISSNLGTGDLLYYNGSTISGATLVQTSSSVMTLKSTSLMLCSNTFQTIAMCSGASSSTAPPSLTIMGFCNCCCYGGDVNIMGGYHVRPSGGVSAVNTSGGDVWVCGGCGRNNITTGGSYAKGGNLYLNGGAAYNSYTAGGARGGCVVIAGGAGDGTTSNDCGGDVYLTSGCGLNGNGGIHMGAGLITMDLDPNSVCVYINRRLDVYGCSGNIGMRLWYGCGYGDWFDTSDRRIKKDIQKLKDIYSGTTALSQIMQLDGVRYRKCTFESGATEEVNYRIGLIAQDVAKVVPEVVGCTPASEGDVAHGVDDIMYSINYGNLTALLIEAVKEQQDMIKDLQQEINTLKNL